MALPLKEGSHIHIERKIFQPGYAMPSMEMATDHYSLGYVISGDRRTITPSGSYSYHAGMVAGSPPYSYHRTMAKSEEPYERILIKFSPEFVLPFQEAVGKQVLDAIYEKRVFSFLPDMTGKIEGMFRDMEEEFQKDRPYKEFILQGMLFRLLAAIWEESLPDEERVSGKTPLTPPIVDALTYMESCYAQNPSLEEAARAANFSPSYFSRLFHAQLGMSYSEYLNNIKLRHVNILLTGTRKSIMEIAQETGFCHGNYLSDQFRKKMGMTPGQFRKKAIK